jgi:hypothetical protein
MNAERALAAVRAWKARLITAEEASEVVGVESEAELLEAAEAARAGGSMGSASPPMDNVRPFPSRRKFEGHETKDSGAFIRSRR